VNAVFHPSGIVGLWGSGTRPAPLPTSILAGDDLPAERRDLDDLLSRTHVRETESCGPMKIPPFRKQAF